MQVEQPDLKEPHYRPAVKFRKINKDTLTRLQTKGDNDENQSSELNEEESEDDGNEEETRSELPNLTGNPFAKDSESAGCRTPFKVDPTIDLKSHALIDMISPFDSDSERTSAAPTLSIPTEPKDEISVEEAFESW